MPVVVAITTTMLLAVSVPMTHAHPHAFANTRYKLVFDEQGLQGIQVYWVFDEMYSAMTGPEFDLDGDGTFNEQESEELAKLAHESLPSFNYFTHITVDGKQQSVKSVRDLDIRYDEGILYYEFFIDCRIKAGNKKHSLKVSPYDPDFFVALLFPDDDPILLENDEPFFIETSLGEDPDTLIYFDMIHPMALQLEFQRKQ